MLKARNLLQQARRRKRNHKSKTPFKKHCSNFKGRKFVSRKEECDEEEDSGYDEGFDLKASAPSNSHGVQPMGNLYFSTSPHNARDAGLAPLRPSVTINSQAATRFIEHSLPDLSRDQKQSLREISTKGKAPVDYAEKNRKRKYQSTGKQSAQVTAKEFLEKASRELLGDEKDRVKGPVKEMDTDDEIDAMFGDTDDSD